jgi:hypothetical protein
LQMGEIAKIKLILREQMSPNNMFVSSFFDNSGEIKTVTPLILELGWLRPEFATGPLVVFHQKYLEHFQNLVNLSDESIFWKPVIGSSILGDSSVFPLDPQVALPTINFSRETDPLSYHDLHRDVLSLFSNITIPPNFYGEVLMGLASGALRENSKSKAFFKLERIATRIVFPPSSYRRTILLYILRKLKILS